MEGFGGGVEMVTLISFIAMPAASTAALVVLLRRRALRWSDLPVGRRRVALALSGFAILCPIVGLTLVVARGLAGWPMALGEVLMPWAAVGMACNAASIMMRTSRRAESL